MRFEIEGCLISRGRIFWLVLKVVDGSDARECVFTSRDENAVHSIAESLAISNRARGAPNVRSKRRCEKPLAIFDACSVLPGIAKRERDFLKNRRWLQTASGVPFPEPSFERDRQLGAASNGAVISDALERRPDLLILRRSAFMLVFCSENSQKETQNPEGHGP
jgi:hypothetical protein